jgi:hypothetical protein
MTKTNDQSEETAEKAPQPKKGLDLSPTQVIAGGGAAAVASVIGGQLGLGGTVVGAFILSVISAVAVPLFRASLETSHQQIKRVVPRRGLDATTANLPRVTDTASISRSASSKVSASPLPLQQAREAPSKQPGKSFTARKLRMAVGGTAAIFAVGVGSVIGVQAATGTSLSNGTAALQTGISQVASNAAITRDTPVTNQPSSRDTDPGSTATSGATSPTQGSTAAATPTATASTKQTAPAGKATSQPTLVPSPAAETAAPNSDAYGTDEQADPHLPAATGGAAGK